MLLHYMLQMEPYVPRYGPPAGPPAPSSPPTAEPARPKHPLPADVEKKIRKQLK